MFYIGLPTTNFAMTVSAT